MLQNLSSHPALLLNADFQPISTTPLSTMNWQEVIKATFKERVIVVEEYDIVVRSEKLKMKLPSVIALKEYQKPPIDVQFNRYNIFLRDNFTCQYCNVSHAPINLTFDHVKPKHLGGKTSWENVVASCRPCNTTKGGSLLKDLPMSLVKEPKEPTRWQLYRNGFGNLKDNLHETWMDYLYWDTKLED